MAWCVNSTQHHIRRLNESGVEGAAWISHNTHKQAIQLYRTPLISTTATTTPYVPQRYYDNNDRVKQQLVQVQRVDGHTLLLLLFLVAPPAHCISAPRTASALFSALRARRTESQSKAAVEPLSLPPSRSLPWAAITRPLHVRCVETLTSFAMHH